MKHGRFPFRASPRSVNCDTTSTPPPTSPTARFIFAAPRPRRSAARATLSARRRASALAVPLRDAEEHDEPAVDRAR